MEFPFLTIDQIKIMDQKAIHDYSISIELMMENAGLQMARMVAMHASKELGVEQPDFTNSGIVKFIH